MNINNREIYYPLKGSICLIRDHYGPLSASRLLIATVSIALLQSEDVVIADHGINTRSSGEQSEHC